MADQILAPPLGKESPASKPGSCRLGFFSRAHLWCTAPEDRGAVSTEGPSIYYQRGMYEVQPIFNSESEMPSDLTELDRSSYGLILREEETHCGRIQLLGARHLFNDCNGLGVSGVILRTGNTV